MWVIKSSVDCSKGLKTLINGELVNLTGEDVLVRVTATKTNPAGDVIIRGATQEDYDYLMSDKVKGNWGWLLEEQPPKQGTMNFEVRSDFEETFELSSEEE